jgi:hypothetical protein
VADHLERAGIQADRADGFGLGMHRLRFDRYRRPRVSVLAQVVPGPSTASVPSHGAVVERIGALIAGTTYPSFEVVIAAPGAIAADLASALLETAPALARVVEVGDGTSASEAVNAAARAADGELLLMLDVNLQTLTEDWLTALQGYAQRPAIGAVGPKVYAHDGTIAHAGIVLPRGVPHHVHHGKDGASWFGHILHAPGNYSAVSGACLMTRRSLFLELGGFREPDTVGYSDVDYCLRLRERDYRIVYTPYAELRYVSPMEYVPPPLEAQQRAALHRQWPNLPSVDPYYNPYFDQRDGQFTIDPYT